MPPDTIESRLATLPPLARGRHASISRGGCAMERVPSHDHDLADPIVGIILGALLGPVGTLALIVFTSGFGLLHIETCL